MRDIPYSRDTLSLCPNARYFVCKTSHVHDYYRVRLCKTSHVREIPCVRMPKYTSGQVHDFPRARHPVIGHPIRVPFNLRDLQLRDIHNKVTQAYESRGDYLLR